MITKIEWFLVTQEVNRLKEELRRNPRDEQKRKVLLAYEKKAAELLSSIS